MNDPFNVLERLNRVAYPVLVRGFTTKSGSVYYVIETSCPMCLGPLASYQSPEGLIETREIEGKIVPVVSSVERATWLVPCGYCNEWLLVRGKRVTPLAFEMQTPSSVDFEATTQGMPVDLAVEIMATIKKIDAGATRWKLHRLAEAIFWAVRAREIMEVHPLARVLLSERHRLALAHPSGEKFGYPKPECWRVERRWFGSEQLRVDSAVSVEIVLPGQEWLPLPAGRYWHASAGFHGVPLDKIDRDRRRLLEELASSHLLAGGEGELLMWPTPQRTGAVHVFRRMTDDEIRLVGRGAA